MLSTFSELTNSEQASVHLFGPFVTEHLTADNYVNFLTKQLHFQWKTCLCRQNAGYSYSIMGLSPPHFGQVTAYLNQRYENRWTGRCDPITCGRRDLWNQPHFISFFGVSLNRRTRGPKHRAREELLHWIMDATACISERPEMIQSSALKTVENVPDSRTYA